QPVGIAVVEQMRLVALVAVGLAGFRPELFEVWIVGGSRPRTFVAVGVAAGQRAFVGIGPVARERQLRIAHLVVALGPDDQVGKAEPVKDLGARLPGRRRERLTVAIERRR